MQSEAGISYILILITIASSEPMDISSQHNHGGDLHQGIEALEDFLSVLHPGAQSKEMEGLYNGTNGTRAAKGGLTPAQDRQLNLNPVGGLEVFDLQFIENKYIELMQSLPLMIDEAREVITVSIATKNKLGYTMVAGFMVGASLDSLALLLLEPVSWLHFVQKITEDRFYGTAATSSWIWWYAFGYAGPWMFPGIFGAGRPELQASSEDYSEVLGKHGLTLGIQSLTDKSPVVTTLLVESLKRDFSLRFNEILSKKEEYVEAERVSETFNQMISLVSHHSQFNSQAAPPVGQADLALLDQSLGDLWDQVSTIEVEVTGEIRNRRAVTALVNIFIALLNIGGMVANIVMQTAAADSALLTFDPGYDKFRDRELGEKITEVISWLTEDSPPPSLYVKELGAAALIAAPLFWGYSYIFPYIHFLESIFPDCGPADQIHARYSELRSVGRLVGSGVSRETVRWRLEGWRRELQVDLNCLINTEEGVRLDDTIDMFHTLAVHRLKY